MVDLAVLADDLTGAADAAASFAAAGLTTAIVFDDDDLPDVDVVVLSTETRDIDAETAVARVMHATQRLLQNPAQRPKLLYKKIDSALRGHPGDELMAVMSASDHHRAVVAPALPAHGRTTVGGRHLIDECPLHETELGREAGTCELAVLFSRRDGPPIHVIDLRAVRKGADRVTTILAADDPGVWIFDAETDQDLAAVATAAVAANVTLLVGSAGLASQLVPILGSTRPQMHPPVCPRVEGPILFVAGSRHFATIAQVDSLERAGVPAIRPPRNGVSASDAAIARTVDELSAALASHSAAVLTTAGTPVDARDTRSVARMLARLTAATAERQPPGALILTGGDVAAAVLEQLGARRLTLGGEIVPAIPWGVLKSTSLPDIPVVTKAGSFGDATTFLNCLAFLRR